VAIELAGGLDRLSRRDWKVKVDRPGPQQADLPPLDGNDRAFKAVLRGPRVENERDAPAQAPRDMLRSCRTDPAAGIGGRRRKRATRRLHEGAHHRMGGRAQRDRLQARRHEAGDLRIGPQRQHERERARPEPLGELSCPVVEPRDPLGLFGMVAVVLIILAAIFADFLAPYDPTRIMVGPRLAPPSWEISARQTNESGAMSVKRQRSCGSSSSLSSTISPSTGRPMKRRTRRSLFSPAPTPC
jgi:hypothetical protein